MKVHNFLDLHSHYGVKLQLGEADQWDTITSGVELGKIHHMQLVALAAPSPPHVIERCG